MAGGQAERHSPHRGVDGASLVSGAAAPRPRGGGRAHGPVGPPGAMLRGAGRRDRLPFRPGERPAATGFPGTCPGGKPLAGPVRGELLPSARRARPLRKRKGLEGPLPGLAQGHEGRCQGAAGFPGLCPGAGPRGAVPGAAPGPGAGRNDPRHPRTLSAGQAQAKPDRLQRPGTNDPGRAGPGSRAGKAPGGVGPYLRGRVPGRFRHPGRHSPAGARGKQLPVHGGGREAEHLPLPPGGPHAVPSAGKRTARSAASPCK